VKAHEKAVTVFVRRVGGVFLAASHEAEAMHPSSDTVAARVCAARHYGVAEARIDLAPAGEHVLIATLAAEPARTAGLAAWAWGAGLAVAATLAVVALLAAGGAR
jgi:hypothetical protein